MECLCDLLSLIEEILERGKDTLCVLLDSVEAILGEGLDVTAGDADHTDAHLGQIFAEGLELIVQMNDKRAMIADEDDKQTVF